MSERLPLAPHVLVTASGAIGSAIARELRARDPERASTGRCGWRSRPSGFGASFGGEMRTKIVDLCEIDALAARLVEQAQNELGPIDGLVNAAGFMEVQRFESMPWELVWRLLAVDLVAPLRLASACVGSIGERRGFIVNVTSMAGRVPIKGCSVYGAAKAGLGMASEISRSSRAWRTSSPCIPVPSSRSSSAARVHSSVAASWRT
jgi:3-hydroxybutyrate dehydrogenase